MTEKFRPKPILAPTSMAKKSIFYGRMVLDLQLLTVYRDLAKHVPLFKGHVLDVGCGDSPFRFLLNDKLTRYYGIDISDAKKFDYHNDDIIAFNGKNIPYPDEMFDAIICTEVLEHVPNYQELIDEMQRTLKPGATGIFTIPWSARYHYIPFDYFRYTPSSLKTMFNKFSAVTVTPRSTDIATLGNKVVVIWFRNLLPSKKWKYIFIPFWVLISPVVLIVLLLAHLDTLIKIGSTDDPLGYTIVAIK